MGEEKIRQADLFPIFLSTHFLFYLLTTDRLPVHIEVEYVETVVALGVADRIPGIVFLTPIELQ